MVETIPIELDNGDAMLPMLLGLMFACENKTDEDSPEPADTSATQDTDDTQDTQDTDDSGDEIGGPCEYDDYPGTCTMTDDSTVTYTGTIEGTDVSLAGNTYSPQGDEEAPESGEAVDCTLSYITAGTCTPCILSVGECGEEAFDYFSNLID